MPSSVFRSIARSPGGDGPFAAGGGSLIYVRDTPSPTPQPEMGFPVQGASVSVVPSNFEPGP